MKTKICSRCKDNLPLERFAKQTSQKDGLFCYCRTCNTEYQREYRATVNGRRKSKSVQLKAKYGITLECYEEMHDEQKGLCAICGNPESAASNIGGEKLLAVDHNHETGEVRGLLCQACNVGLGHFTTPERLMAAASYLIQNETSAAIA
jgi:hypothetical protein